MRSASGIVVGFALGLFGCSSADEPARDRSAGGAGTAGVAGAAGAAGGAGAAGVSGVGGTAGLMTATGGASGGGTGGEGPNCAGLSAEAEAELLPTDVIWAIDTSGSMTASFPAIQQALADFSQRMVDAGIDAHIVLLAGAVGLCVPPPLGSGACGAAASAGGAAPDSREPALLHLDLPFGSTQGMATLLDNHPAYKHLLRPNARTHLVLTEDGQPPQSPQQVIDHLEGRAAATFTPAWNPPLAPASWVFHGVVCKDGVGTGTCLLAFGAPQTTLALISQTGGLLSNLDDAGNGSGIDPFGQLLEALAEQVIVGARVSCDYEIPAPPEDMLFDRDAVNVIYVDGQLIETTFPRVPDELGCDAHLGWKYDDPLQPSRVVLCPAACEAVQADVAARVDVKFGCQTEVLVVE